MERARTKEQHIADFLRASGYEPETIVRYLEAIAAAGRADPRTGKVVIADTVYNWAEDVRRPTLYEFEKIPRDDERKPRVKTWRSLGRGKLHSRVTRTMRSKIGRSRGVNVKPQAPPLQAPEPPPEPAG